MRSGLLVEDVLQKAALWQLEKLQGEMERYTNLPLSCPKSEENRMDGGAIASRIFKLEHRVRPEDGVKDGALKNKDEKVEEWDSDKVCVLNGKDMSVSMYVFSLTLLFTLYRIYDIFIDVTMCVCKCERKTGRTERCVMF